MSELQNIYTKRFILLAGECDSQSRMPITLLVSRIIEVASLHANSWNVGFEELAKSNQTWVLLRIAFEMTRYPKPNEEYSLTTWIEGYNSHFSERNFEIKDGEGNVLGYARTIWTVIDSETRHAADIAKFAYIRECIIDKECPIAKPSRPRAIKNGRSAEYTFRYSDIDFNRHVNTCRYIDLFLNQWSLDFHDTHRISRFEIAFMKEAYYNQSVTINVDDSTDDCAAELIDTNDGSALCRTRLVYTEENYNKEQ